MFYVIVNPAARSGEGLEVWHRTEALLKRKNISYQAAFTRYPGHGRKLARMMSVKAKGQRLLVIGGDGTLDEVLNGLAPHADITLSYLPVGSGNDFARGMNIPRDHTESLRHLVRARKPRPLDIGTVKTPKLRRRFGISAGIGYDAAVCKEVSVTPVKNLLNKMHLGNLVYAWAAVKMLFTFQPSDMDVILDGKEMHFHKVYFIAAMNQPYEGGGFKFCPEASSGDGIMDFIVVHDLAKWQILLLFPTAYFAKHTWFPGITLLKGTSMSITSSLPQIVHHDGEYGGITDRISFGIQKHAFDFL